MRGIRAVPAVIAAGIVLLTTATAAPAVTWKRVASGTTDSIAAIDYHSPTQLSFATTAGNIFARQPNGSFGLQASFPGRQFSDIAFRPTGDVGLATADTGHLFRFANGAWAPVSLAGATFDHDCPDLPEPPYARTTPVDNLVAVGWSTDAVAWVVAAGTGEVLKSVDAGATWTDVSRQPDGSCRLPEKMVDVAPVPGSADDAYFLGQDAFLYRTADGLASPAVDLRGMPSCSVGNQLRLAVDPAGPSRVSDVSACLGDWGFSHDSGTSYDTVQPTLDDVPLRDIAAGPGVFVAVGDKGKIERTFDGVGLEKIPARGALAHEGWLSVDLADRAHAAVGGVGGALILSADVGPFPTIVVGKGLRARRSGRRVTLRVRGRLRPPRGIAAAVACHGSVFLTVKRGRRLLASRNAAVHPSCRFSKTIRIASRRVGGARKLTVVVRFGGNQQLGVRRRTLHVRVQR